MTGRTRSCHNRPTGSRMDQRRGLSALRRVPFSRVYPTPRWSVSPARASGRSSKPARQFVQYQDPSTDAFFLTAGKLRVIVYSLEGTAVYSSPPGPKPPRDDFRGIHPRPGRLEEVDAYNDRGRKIRQPRRARTFNEAEKEVD